MSQVTQQLILQKEHVLLEEERIAQTKLIMRLFELWQLSTAEQAICLGLSPNTQTNIHKYKNGKAYLPLHRDTQDRIRFLLTIHKYLRKLFPRNNELAYQWIKISNKYFNNFAPLDIIIRDGLLGLDMIAKYLEASLSI